MNARAGREEGRRAAKDEMAAHLVFLPATALRGTTYGTIPSRIPEFPGVAIHQVHFPTMVWYNRSVRAKAIRQIRGLGVAPVILVGFSKSGLGAWNIARELPECVSATLIFDAPVACEHRPPWGTDPFYRDDATWCEDLPIRQVRESEAPFPAGRRLVLVSGKGFHDEMVELARALERAGVAHSFLPCPDRKHHWNSGWIEEAIRLLLPGSLNAENLTPGR